METKQKVFPGPLGEISIFGILVVLADILNLSRWHPMVPQTARVQIWSRKTFASVLWATDSPRRSEMDPTKVGNVPEPASQHSSRNP